jgi:hypothetical protein
LVCALWGKAKQNKTKLTTDLISCKYTYSMSSL